MNNRENAVNGIEEFLDSNEKAVLITGTNQYEKHKLVMKIINTKYKNAKILFRINSMQNITDDVFLGWCGLNKKPKAGETIKIGKNYYQFDSSNTKNTWNNSGHKFDLAILYPLDSAYNGDVKSVLKDLYEFKDIGKVFLISWTDSKKYDYNILSEFYSKHIIYDALEEDEAYHNRVLEICEKY